MAKTTTSKKLTYNVDGYAGLAHTNISRRSGTQVNIWFNEEAGRPTKDGAWSVECEDHGKSKTTATRKEARYARLDPASFCPTCKAAQKRTSKKAA